MIHRWQEYTTLSMLVNHTEKNNTFYFSYPNINCDQINMIFTAHVLGVFQDTSQVVGIGIYKTKKEDINKIFD